MRFRHLTSAVYNYQNRRKWEFLSGSGVYPFGRSTTSLFSDTASTYIAYGTEVTGGTILNGFDRTPNLAWDQIGVWEQPDPAALTQGELFATSYRIGQAFTSDPASVNHYYGTNTPQNLEQSVSAIDFTDLDDGNWYWGASFSALGYFKPPTDGNYSFKLSGNMHSGIWLNKGVLDKHTYSPIISNSTSAVTVYLKSDTYYPINVSGRLERNNTPSIKFEWADESGVFTTNLTNHFYYFGDGSTMYGSIPFESVSGSSSALFSDTASTFVSDGTEVTGGTILDGYARTEDVRWDFLPSVGSSTVMFADTASTFVSDGTEVTGNLILDGYARTESARWDLLPPVRSSHFLNERLQVSTFDFNPGRQHFTLEFWIKSDFSDSQLNNSMAIATNSPDSTNTTGFNIRASGKVYIGSTLLFNSFLGGWNQGGWNHIAFTRRDGPSSSNPDDYSLWVNGTFVGGTATDFAADLTSGELYLGGYPQSSVNDFTGNITGVKMTVGQALGQVGGSFPVTGEPTTDNPALTVEKDGTVLTFESGEELVVSGSSSAVFLDNASTFVSDGTEVTGGTILDGYARTESTRWDMIPPAKTARFNYSEGLNVESQDNDFYLDPGLNDFTLEFWWKPNNSDEIYKSLLKTYTWEISNLGRVENRVGNTNVGLNNPQVQHTTIGEWNHFAFTREGTIHKTYLNGAYIGSTTATKANWNSATLYIGGYSSGQDHYNGFDGYITSVKLTTGQILYSGTGQAFAPTGQPTSDDVPFTMEKDGVFAELSELPQSSGSSVTTPFANTESKFTLDGIAVTGDVVIGGTQDSSSSLWTVRVPNKVDDNLDLNTDAVASNTGYVTTIDGIAVTGDVVIGGTLDSSTSVWSLVDTLITDDKLDLNTDAVASNNGYLTTIDGIAVTGDVVIGGTLDSSTSIWTTRVPNKVDGNLDLNTDAVASNNGYLTTIDGITVTGDVVIGGTLDSSSSMWQTKTHLKTDGGLDLNTDAVASNNGYLYEQ